MKTKRLSFNEFVFILLALLFVIIGCKKKDINNDSEIVPGDIPIIDIDSTLLCFTALANNVVIEMDTIGVLNPIPTIEYSYDGINWTMFSPGTTVAILNKRGDRVCFRGDNPHGLNVNYNTLQNTNYIKFEIDKPVNVSGNLMSLIDTTYESMSIPDYCFVLLFSNTHIGTAPELPATTLASHCYYGMFAGCTGLTAVPELPATTLASHCYCGMFAGCTGLTAAPELPATTLADNCYNCMFTWCTGLTTDPVLSATTLADHCYNGMFSGCTGLTTAPALPATTLADNCYYNMFSGCTGLTTAPELPATTLADHCYSRMFSNCKSLTTAPVLSATTLASYCYNYMFSGCTGLTAAPALPATTLAHSCYANMFENCINLTTAPELPAITLDNSGGGSWYCYDHMFKNCTSLETAPELPATALVLGSYSEMFCNCTRLNNIKVHFTEWRGDCTYSWLENVAQNGTFYCPNSLLQIFDKDHIPEGWTVETF